METVEKRNAVDAAIASLVVASSKTNESLGSFSGWLAAGVGATFSFLVANIDSVVRFVDTPNLRHSLFLLILSLSASVIARLLSAFISASVASHYAGVELVRTLITSGQGFDLEHYIVEFERGLFWYQRWVVRRTLMKARSGDRVASARLISKMAQILVVFVVAQFAFIAIGASFLVLGL